MDFRGVGVAEGALRETRVGCDEDDAEVGEVFVAKGVVVRLRISVSQF